MIPEPQGPQIPRLTTQLVEEFPNSISQDIASEIVRDIRGVDAECLGGEEVTRWVGGGGEAEDGGGGYGDGDSMRD